MLQTEAKETRTRDIFDTSLDNLVTTTLSKLYEVTLRFCFVERKPWHVIIFITTPLLSVTDLMQVLIQEQYIYHNL